MISVDVLKKQGTGIQNNGIWEAVTKDSQGNLKSFIIKLGTKNEFLCSAVLDKMLLRKKIPPYIRFAYPYFAQEISRSCPGTWVWKNQDGNIVDTSYTDYKYETFETVPVFINLEGDEVDDLYAGKKFETYKRIPQIPMQDLFSFKEIPDNWWKLYSKKNNKNPGNVLLFMDKAAGQPGRDFCMHLSEYPEEKIIRIYARLGESMKILEEFYKPDDSQNLDNLIIDIDTETVTYIDFDRSHFYKNNKYYSDLWCFNTSSGDSVLFDWYFPILDNAPFPAGVAFYQTTKSHDALDRICLFSPAFVSNTLVDDNSEFCWLVFREANKFSVSSLRKDPQIVQQFVAKISNMYTERSLDRNKLLSQIISEATNEKAATQLKLLATINQDYVRVVTNDGLLSEEEMWAIQLSKWIPLEYKALLGEAYVNLIPKIVLSYNPEEKMPEELLKLCAADIQTEKLKAMQMAFRMYEQQSNPKKTIYGAYRLSAYKAIRVL